MNILPHNKIELASIALGFAALRGRNRWMNSNIVNTDNTYNTDNTDTSLPLLFCALRYYQEKMGAPPGQQEAVIASIVKSYVEGLCWVMRYYYDGVASWNW